MIRVMYNRRGPVMRLTGHAGYAPAGQDIVCAAVSGCLYTVLAMLPDHPGRRIRWAPGDVVLAVPGRRARWVLDRAAEVLEQIAQQYPGQVQVERR